MEMLYGVYNHLVAYSFFENILNMSIIGVVNGRIKRLTANLLKQAY